MFTRNIYVACFAVITIFQLSACSWVDISEEGKKVEVRSPDDVVNCKRVANTTASLKADILGVDRKKEKVKTEMETLARNAAPQYGGNVVVPESEIENGKQTFGVYKCD